MSQEALINPKVFISYSWTSSEHEEWVVQLAKRLRADGIDVVLDKWDLKVGHDIYAFMESMVTSESIDKVLIICDKGYKEKAENREKGVGTETQIITPQIYNDTQQEKFIPIVAERDENGNNYIPAYIGSRVYIDLSSPDFFEENYETLLRTIYKVPLYKKPALGKPPAYLFQDEVPHFKTAIILRQMRSVIDKFPKRLAHLWDDFTEEFLESLEDFTIKKVENPNEIDEQVIEILDKLLPLRNDFIESLELLSLTDNIEAEHIINFFEEIYKFSEFQGDGSYYRPQLDHFKFLITELFLYSIAILLKRKKYLLISQILNSDFVLNSKYKDRTNYTGFRFHLPSLEYRKERLGLNRLSLHADLLIERVYKNYLSDLISTDILLYYISVVIKNKSQNIWFPTTYIYFPEDKTIKILARLNSKSHFENIKCLFNVETKDELIEKMDNINFFNSTNNVRYTGSWDRVPNIDHFIKPEEICTSP